MSAQSSRSPLFVRLALVMALLTLGLIVVGAVVRVSDSGLGCGEHWPLCNGSIIPPLDNITAWIEWSHRLLAFLIGLFGVGMLVLAVRAFRQSNRRALGMTVAAAILFFIQSSLGALVVVLKLPPTMVTLHLGTAMLLLAALMLSGLLAAYKPEKQYAPDRVSTLAYGTALLSLVIILTGALVRGSGATLACVDWPLCNGEILPLGQGQLATIHMFHRFAVVALGISLLILVTVTLRDRQNKQVRLLAVSALAVYLAQAGVGAMFVMTQAQPIWGAAHVGLAGTTWVLLVILSAIEWLNTRQPGEVNERQWEPQSKITPSV